jgi:hypothetical protein
MPKDKAPATDNVRIVLRGPDGQIKQERQLHNLIVTTGRDAIVEQLVGSPAIDTPSHMAVGTSGTAPAAGNTALGGELDRQALTSKTRSGNVLTMVGDFGAGDGTGAIQEAGIFNAASSGTLYARAVFSTINKGADDSLEITWDLTLSVSS